MILIGIAISSLILGLGLWTFILPFTSRYGLMEYLESGYRTVASNVVVIVGFVLVMAGFISFVFGLALAG